MNEFPFTTERARVEATKDRQRERVERARKTRCACARCGVVRYLYPDEVGALHYTQRDGYVCGPSGRYMPAPLERT